MGGQWLAKALVRPRAMRRSLQVMLPAVARQKFAASNEVMLSKDSRYDFLERRMVSR